MIKKVYTSAAPEAIGPYSQAIICGNMLFTSGQVPINPATGEVEAEGLVGREQTQFGGYHSTGNTGNEEPFGCSCRGRYIVRECG